MNNELKDLLRLVLKEELAPMNVRLNEIDKSVNALKTGQFQLEKHIEKLKFGQEQLGKDVKDLLDGQERLQRNIIESLGDYTDKITEYVDDKTGALNKRVFLVETEIERLSRQ